MKTLIFRKNRFLKNEKTSKRGETPCPSVRKSLDQGEFLDEYEYCVSCWKRTDVLVSTNIESRKYYVVGCGQLCQECYYDLLNE